MADVGSGFKAQLLNVILYKFGVSLKTEPDTINAIDILPQVIEVNMFQTIYSPVMRAELLIHDPVGLFVNFPLTGEEFVKVIFKVDDDEKEYFYVIEAINNITVSKDMRSSTYVMNLITVEALANSLRKVQKCYNGKSNDAVKAIYKEYIEDPLKQLAPSYVSRPFITTETNTEIAKTIIVPNVRPFEAISMISAYHQPLDDDRYSYLLFQNSDGFNYTTLQDLHLQTTKGAKRRDALRNKYRYISDQIDTSQRMDNEGRLVTNLTYNNRFTTIEKIALGYFQNNLVEINMHQKAYFTTKKTTDDTTTIYKNKLNTDAYSKAVQINTDNESSNRTKYMINNQKENDESYPISDFRNRWGRDIASKVAFAQIDLTVTIPGNYKFSAGDLFYLDVPEAHGFNELNEDDLISGYFLITEVVHTIQQNGNFSSSMRINKDSYETSVDRKSRFK